MVRSLKKIGIFTAFVLLFLNKAFSFDGIMTGEKDLRISKTQWFDIIYPLSEELTAKILYKDADQIYTEVCEQLGTEPYFRMPVVISGKIENLNATWSSAYYNHIVIQDAAVQDSLTVFSENILSIFRHEVTHAVTFNMKNDFWKTADFVTGDCVNPAAIFVNSGMAEGATLTSESLNGEGRLNSDFALHCVKQAKIENKFPSYSDEKGAKTDSDAGNYYYYNGMFHDWLQKNYGIEKYVEYWNKCVNFLCFTNGGAFKNVYGISLSEAWKKFYESIPVPAVEPDPVKKGLVEQISKSQIGNYSQLNLCSKGLYFVSTKTNSVYFIKNENLSSKKAEVLCSVKNLRAAKLSDDGKYALITSYDKNLMDIKAVIQVYDAENKAFMPLPGSGFYDGTILKSGKDYFLYALHYKDSIYSVQKYKINFDEKNRIQGFELVLEKKFDINEIPQNIVALQRGNNEETAFILQKGLEKSVCIADKDLEALTEYKVPETQKIEIRYLSYSDNRLCFSWAEKNSLTRFAYLNLKDEKFYFNKEDISGGIFYPVLKDEHIYYVGKFYNANKVLKKGFKMGEEALICEVFPAQKSTYNSQNKLDLYKEKIQSEPFYNFYGEKKGILIPFSVIQSNSYESFSTSSYSIPFGVTYLTSNPWTSGIFTTSLGCSIALESVAAYVKYSSSTASENLSYSAALTSEIDKLGWKKENFEESAAISFPFTDFSRLVISESGLLNLGRTNLLSEKASNNLSGLLKNKDFASYAGYAFNNDRTNYIYTYDNLVLQYSKKRQWGEGKNQYSGFSAAAIGLFKFSAPLQALNDYYSRYFDLGFNVNFYIPKLFPIKETPEFEFSGATVLSLYLFAEESDSKIVFYKHSFGKSGVPALDEAAAAVNTQILYWNIQKGLGDLFVEAFKMELNFKGGYSYTLSENSKSLKIAKIADFAVPILKGTKTPGYIAELSSVLYFKPNFGQAVSLNSSLLSLNLGISQVNLKNNAVPYVSISYNLNFDY